MEIGGSLIRLRILGAAASSSVMANGPAAQTGAATSTTQFALIRFDKKNWQSAVAAVEAQTGIKVERVEEK